MKKFFTLVLALVLVFAIAAPALAITGDVTAPETGAGAPAQLEVRLITGPASTGFGGFALTTVAANKLYVANEMAYYAVAVKFNSDTPSMNAADYTGAVLSISSDAIAITAAPEVKGFTSAGVAVNTWVPAMALNTAGTAYVSATAPAVAEFATGNIYYFVGSGLVTKQGVVKASFGTAAGTSVNVYAADNTTIKYNVTQTGANFVVTKGAANGTAGAPTVTFETDATTEEVLRILVGTNPVEFKKLISGGGSVVTAVGALTGTALTDAIALYNEVMGFFGFNYDAEGILEIKHFASKATLLNLKSQANVTLYTGSLVVPGGADVPKTGDAASIMGFVMITLAMVAAGFVVSRKVRA